MIYQHEKREPVYRGPRPNFPGGESDLIEMMDGYLRDRHLKPRIAHLNDWYPTSELDGEPRIVIPCSNSAHVPYFQARYMGNDPDVKRYTSPRASREDSLAIVWPEGLRCGTILCEGPMDALAAAEFGFVGIALMGNTPNQEAIRFAAHTALNFPPVRLIPDGDALSEAATLLGYFSMIGLKLKMLTLPKKDLAEMSPSARKKILSRRD